MGSLSGIILENTMLTIVWYYKRGNINNYQGNHRNERSTRVIQHHCVCVRVKHRLRPWQSQLDLEQRQNQPLALVFAQHNCLQEQGKVFCF